MKISSIENDLFKDLKEGRLKLDFEDITINNNIYADMVDPKNDQKFFSELARIAV